MIISKTKTVKSNTHKYSPPIISYTSYRFFIFIVVSILLFASPLSPNQFNSNSGDEDTVKIVDKFGKLRVEGTKIVDEKGNPVVLRGMSLYWSQWIGKYYNYDCIKWLRDDWKCTVVRAAMAVEGGGYLSNPSAEKSKIKKVIDACIDLGIYVIVDWHDHNAQNHRAQAISFFKEIATLYGDRPNLIYEIFNEPLNTVTWANDVKPYADSVVSNIRAIDPDNLILVGSPNWSQDVDVAAKNPLKFNNVVYTLHYYAATHKQQLRNKATTALSRGAALFVSEFGTCESSGSGVLDSVETEAWFKFLEKNKISWCNWSIADISETSAALKSGASANGGWNVANLSKSGSLVRNKIISLNDSIFTYVNVYSEPAVILQDFELQQNYPNPFNPGTKINYILNKNGLVKFEIYDINGQKIKSLFSGYKNKGHHSLIWDGITDEGIKASSGVYFFHLVFENQRQVLKGILLK